jgi:predicted dehydrogenase
MIRIGISGCGAVAQLNYRPALQVLASSGEAMLAGGFDPAAGAAKRLCKAFPGARPVGSLEELLQLQLDLLIVASPPARHADQACAAIAAGIAVLCEKPMALTVADAERIVEAARPGSAPVAIGMVRRFLPQPQMIRAMLGNGDLGELRRIEIFEGGPFNWPVASPDYFDPERGGGGVLEDIGVHVLDLLRWWLGEPDDVRYADDALGGVAANCRIELRFGATQVAARLSRDWHRPNGFRLIGDGGWLHWAIHERDELELGAPGQRAGTFVPCESASYADATAAQIRAVIGKGAGVVSADDGLQTVRLIDQCRRNRVPMLMEWL